MREMAREELDACQTRQPELEEQIKLLLVPADPQDGRNAILEIRGGTGMKRQSLPATSSACTPNTAESKDGEWRYPAPTKCSRRFQEIVCSVTGDNVYGTLKYDRACTACSVCLPPETQKDGGTPQPPPA